VEWMTKSVRPGLAIGLAIGEKVLDDFIVKNSHKKKTDKAAKGSANAEGANTCGMTLSHTYLRRTTGRGSRRRLHFVSESCVTNSYACSICSNVSTDCL
jgi:hypothetical protein